MASLNLTALQVHRAASTIAAYAEVDGTDADIQLLSSCKTEAELVSAVSKVAKMTMQQAEHAIEWALAWSYEGEEDELEALSEAFNEACEHIRSYAD